MEPQANNNDFKPGLPKRAIAALIETYRQGFLNLDPDQIGSIWDGQNGCCAIINHKTLR